MKNFKISKLLMVAVLAATFFSCNKNAETSLSDWNNSTERDHLKQNEATWIYSHDASKGLFFKLKFFLGHTAAQCGNRCVTFLGESFHIDCRGFGNNCVQNISAKVIEDPLTGELQLIFMDDEIFDEFEIFPFPDRCFFITNPQNNLELWLNIPEQLLSKDSIVTEIVIQNAWFSEEPELDNE